MIVIILVIVYIIFGIIVSLLCHFTAMKHDNERGSIYKEMCKNHKLKLCARYIIVTLFYPALMIYTKLRDYVYSHDEW